MFSCGDNHAKTPIFVQLSIRRRWWWYCLQFAISILLWYFVWPIICVNQVVGIPIYRKQLNIPFRIGLQCGLFDINMLLMIYNSNNGMNMSLLNCWLAIDIALINNSDYVTNECVLCMLFCLLLLLYLFFNSFTHSLWAYCPRDWLVWCITLFIHFFFIIAVYSK